MSKTEKSTEQSANKPVIIQFESEEFYRAVVSQLLYTVDMELAATAKSKKDAEKLIGKIINKELTPTIAIVDSLLEDRHSEGEVIAKKIREVSPETKIIAYTILEDVEWADYVAIKSNRIPSKTIIRGLADLLKIEFPTSNDAAKYNSD